MNKDMKNSERVFVRITPDIAGKIKAYQERYDVQKSQIVRMALRQFLNGKGITENEYIRN